MLHQSHARPDQDSPDGPDAVHYGQPLYYQQCRVACTYRVLVAFDLHGEQ